MKKLLEDVETLGGLASMAELLIAGQWRDPIEMAVRYGSLIRVRKGWYAAPGEADSVVRAWRVGGRLACASAVAYHCGGRPPQQLHVEVPGNAARLRSPDDHRRALEGARRVVIHWARELLPGDRRAVSLGAAREQARHCGEGEGEGEGEGTDGARLGGLEGVRV